MFSEEYINYSNLQIVYYVYGKESYRASKIYSPVEELKQRRKCQFQRPETEKKEKDKLKVKMLTEKSAAKKTEGEGKVESRKTGTIQNIRQK